MRGGKESEMERMIQLGRGMKKKSAKRKRERSSETESETHVHIDNGRRSQGVGGKKERHRDSKNIYK